MAEEFLRCVDSGERTVYYEEIKGYNINALRPFIAGCILSFISLIIMIAFQDSEFVFLFVLLFPGYVLLGTMVTLAIATRMSTDSMHYGVRGLSRSQLSQAIHFLDMILNHRADAGKIIGSPRPEEHTHITTMAYISTIQVLKAVDSETSSMWMSTVKEKLQPSISAKAKYFVWITVFGTFICMFITIGLLILRMVGAISNAVLLPSGIILVSVMGVFVSSFAVYVRISSSNEPPAEFVSALEDPEFQYQTERALEMIFSVVKIEGTFPLRVLVLGSHESIYYTDHTYRTSKELDLIAGIVFPNSITAMEDS